MGFKNIVIDTRVGNVSGYVYAPIGGAVRTVNTPAGYLPLSGATVTSNGKSTTTDSEGYYFLAGIPIGPQNITITKSGYGSITKNANVIEDSTIIVTKKDDSGGVITLLSSGSVSIVSFPASATIYVDSTSVGLTTPQTLNGLSTGTHGFYVSLACYYTATQTLNIEPGGKSNITFNLNAATCCSNTDCISSTPYCLNSGLSAAKCVECMSNEQCGSNATCADNRCVSNITTWSRTYGSNLSELALSADATSDGGSVIAGYNESYLNGPRMVWIMKLDNTGNKLWDKYFGGLRGSEAYSIQQTSDEGFIAAGHTYTSSKGSADVYILKLNKNGDFMWQKIYGGTDFEGASSIQQTTDNGYIVAATTYTNSSGDGDYWILKLNSNGEKVWEKTYGGSFDDQAQSIKQTTDGGYIVTGFTRSFGAGKVDVWTIKLNSTGERVWEKTFGGAEDDSSAAVIQTPDGGFVIAGYTTSFGAGFEDGWLIKLDSSGNQLWAKTFGGSYQDFFNDVELTTDNGYIVAGFTNSYGSGSDSWILKFDASGSQQWSKMYNNANFDYAYSVNHVPDGGYIMAGGTGAYYDDFWILKLDDKGECAECFK